MQRQSFDFQLTELPISLVLISHTLLPCPGVPSKYRCFNPFHCPTLNRLTNVTSGYTKDF